MLESCSDPLLRSSDHNSQKGRGGRAQHSSDLSLQAGTAKTDGEQVNQQEIIKLNSSSQISPVQPSKCELKHEVCWPVPDSPLSSCCSIWAEAASKQMLLLLLVSVLAVRRRSGAG